MFRWYLPILTATGAKGQGQANNEVYSHIVNVTALEGKFNVGKKSGGHPHTNMAKAALNMMTLTGARDYARTGILMNSVDTVRTTPSSLPIFPFPSFLKLIRDSFFFVLTQNDILSSLTYNAILLLHRFLVVCCFFRAG